MIVVIVGPTASGKTALSLALAERLDGEIVNTDSVALYRGMDIGSAKPSVAERERVPHHLIDVLDVADEASVAQFQTEARRAIDEIESRDQVAILVGGSSLYIRAVIDDLDFPGTDPQVRARWQARLDVEGSVALHEVLAGLDPEAARVILPSNGRRIVRALEVIELTGKPFIANLPDHVSRYEHLTMIGLDIDRTRLDERLADRVRAMWAAGFIDEVRSLGPLGPTASRALGYQQATAQLAGEMSEAEAIEATITGHRKFARRQDRMFRKDPRVTWLPFDDEQLVDNVVKRVGPGA